MRDDPWEPLVGPLVEQLARTLTAHGAATDPAPLRLQLDRTGGERGDIALPLHRYAKALGRDPVAFAREVAEALPPLPGVARI
ncbi:MAG TPA: hypothetical protein VIZ68_08300, partial [Thermoplasmata archaeon]